MQELDKSFTERRQLISVAHKLDSEIAQLERDKSVDPKAQAIESGVGVSKFKSPSNRKRRSSKHDVDSPMSSKLNKVSVLTQDVYRQVGKVPTGLGTSKTVVQSSEQYDTAVSLASLLMRSSGHNFGAAVRTVNGDVLPDRSVKSSGVASDGNKTGPSGQWVRLVDKRPGSSSSTDSAESVRNLEQGACVSNFDQYTLKNNGSLVAAALVSRAVETAGAFTGEGGLHLPGSGIQGRGLMALLPLASGVSFPSSRSELEQYKLMVHGSANVSNVKSTLAMPGESRPAAKKARKRASDPVSGVSTIMQNTTSAVHLTLGSYSSLPSLVAVEQSAMSSNRSSLLEDVRQNVLPAHVEGIKHVFCYYVCHWFIV